LNHEVELKGCPIEHPTLLLSHTDKRLIFAVNEPTDRLKTPPKIPTRSPTHVIIIISKAEVNQMGYATGSNRNQMSYWSIEDMVDEKSMVRIIDRFIEVQNFEELNFTRTTPAATGRRPYSPQMLAKLYVYGYENGIRSSRKLEKETKRNIEVMWLMEGLTPDHITISEFRRLT